MYMDEARISVSVLAVELHAGAAGTQLILTEQGVFLDGHDKPEYRESGMNRALDSLGVALETAPAGAETTPAR